MILEHRFQHHGPALQWLAIAEHHSHHLGVETLEFSKKIFLSLVKMHGLPKIRYFFPAAVAFPPIDGNVLNFMLILLTD